ncbi:Mif2/CENP-C like-domain-containing protein [Mycena epipterygia]|nr:Mif2/CENP-C like-domain-containing protein [Mycena epipterygia]
MPPSARKSSVGAARRAGQKSHVPYRGDDPNVGRKTGILVQPVPRGSDGFEPFDQLIGQVRDAAPRKRKKKSVPQDAEEDEDDDEDGEMSMDVDSPVQNYTNNRAPATPRTPRSRPVARTSEVDFDQVPSPRTRASGGRTAGPSRLAKSAQELLDQDEEEEDYDGGGGGFDDYGPQESPRQLSFTEMDTRDDDDDEEEEEEPPIVSPKRGKKTAVEPVQEPEDEMEDDIERGMDIDMEPGSDEETQSPPRKPERPVKAKPKPPIRTKLQKENRDVPEGVRRSKRVPYAPLEWWRLERVVWGGRDPDGDPILVPYVKEVIRIPQAPVVPLGKKGRSRRRSNPRPNSKVVEKVVEKIVEVPSHANPEEGWDDETAMEAVVKDFRTGADVNRRIAFTAKMFSPAPAANNEWFFQKIFSDGDFMAAGQLIIPPKGRKPSKPTRDNTFIFLVIEGAVNLKVCDTSLIVASGGMFMIPRGNTYFIENIADRDAKLFFTQARKLREDEEDDDVRLASSSGLAAAPGGRAVSVAVNGSAPARGKEPAGRRGVSLHV